MKNWGIFENVNLYKITKRKEKKNEQKLLYNEKARRGV